MRNWRLWDYAKFMLLLVALIIGVNSNSVFAITSSSNNYQITETELGGTSSSQNCSSQYCARASIGDMTAGSSKDAQATATFGPVTDSDPLLEVIVSPGISDLGTLSTDRTATKTATVQVRNYLSGGYMVQVTGSPPKYKDHILSTPNTPTVSVPGTEQFAINATANTNPNMGASVIQFPDDLTSFGRVEDNYNIPNKFMYNSGDVVAHSSTESGESKYTISMIVNVSNQTPAGHFTGDFSAVVIPIF